jgi:prolyl-tRNA synthetase
MKLSKYFVKTRKETSSNETSKNAQLLIKAGFVQKTMAGVYNYLPLGMRVLNKIENIVRKHIDSIGGQEILMSSLSPKENWIKTNRWDTIPEYFTLLSQSGTEYRLNPTHEEVVSPIASEYVNSYKDLPEYNQELNIYPLSIYQIQNKFRDELRAKAGLMRGREFRMKDMYDFHQTKESQDNYFELVTETYHKIFADMGLKSYTVNASGGVFSEKFSREFQTLCDAGEDWVFLDNQSNLAYNQEIAPAKAIEFDYTNEQELEKTDHYLKDVIGVEALYKHLNIPITKTTKTLFFEDQDQKLVVGCVRGDRDISMEKLQKICSKKLILASQETVYKYTNSEIGYAGIINLPDNIEIYYDDSISKLKNFETGTNKTGYHSTNVCFERDLKYPTKFYDIKEAIDGDINPETNQSYQVIKGCEIGNIFDLGQKWVKAFEISYLDKNGVKQYPYMGCHGIGTSRSLGVIAEIHSDEKGLKWPESVAPYKFHLITHVNPKDDPGIVEKIKLLANQLYNGEIKSLNFEDNQIEIDSTEIIFDDRSSVSLGEKFKDAELIGCPYQLIITSKSLNAFNQGVEIKRR